jgi:hypothetical protein
VKFFAALFSGDETSVDSIVFCGLVSLLAMIGAAVYVAILAPQTFSPITFSTGASAIIGATAAGKTARDRLSTSPPPSPPPPEDPK